MLQAFYGTKIKQTQEFTDAGKRISMTVISVDPGVVTQIIDDKRVQLGFGSAKHIAKAQEGALKKAGLDIKPRFLRVIELAGAESPKVGDKVAIENVFQVGDAVNVIGISRGMGFAGVVKRHGFHGGPRTHGQSDRERSPGSIGQTTTPGRVYRGKRMAGHAGNARVTVRGLSIVGIDAQKHLLMVKGVVPGAKNSLVEVSKRK